MQNSPGEKLPKIKKTLLANPVILVLSAISTVDNAGQVLDHELAGAKRTMVVIPIGALLITAILAMQ